MPLNQVCSIFRLSLSYPSEYSNRFCTGYRQGLHLTGAWPPWVCDKNVDILKTPLWKRGARGDFKKKLLHKIPLHPLVASRLRPLPKGEDTKKDAGQASMTDGKRIGRLGRLSDSPGEADPPEDGRTSRNDRNEYKMLLCLELIYIFI